MPQWKILGSGKMVFLLLQDAFRELQQNDPLRMAAATSFFTSFALPPILIILIEVFSIFGNSVFIRHGLLDRLSIALGKNTEVQIRDTLRNVHHLSLSPGLKIGGFIFLLFVATTLFTVIKNSLNQLWRIRLKKDRGFVFELLYRGKSIGVIILAGVLFFIGFIFPAFSALAAPAWFILLLKFLADGRPSWKVAIAGGIFTGLLFAVGEAMLHFLLSYNKVKTIYGATASLVLLLLFVFYSAFIFYYGACFTKVLASLINQPILPTRNATRYTLKSIEWDGEEKEEKEEKA
ncbi:YihY/virulence factor BrkB family protein [Flavitalea flava]